MERVDSGVWGDLAPESLNERAQSLGDLNELLNSQGTRHAVAPAFARPERS
jgi:hypothetical protein